MITKVRSSTLELLGLLGYISADELGPQSTDITVNLLAALTAGTPVYVPAGTWLIGNITLPAGSTIIGLGHKSILKLKNGANALACKIGTNVYLKDFILDGNKANQVGANFHCFDLTTATGTMENVLAKDPKGCGFITGAGTSNLELINCRATGWTDSGFKLPAGSNLTLLNPQAYSGDAAATGDAFALTSAGSTLSMVNIINPVARDSIGRGIALVGNGSKNIKEVSILNPMVSGMSSHGIHAFTADAINIIGGVCRNNGADGVRLEGDTQNCRVSNLTSRGNTGFGIREVTNGASPNNNGLIYNVSSENVASNVITKVGAGSFIV